MGFVCFVFVWVMSSRLTTIPSTTVGYWKLFTESLFPYPVIGWKTTNHGPLSADLLYHHTCVRSSSWHPFFSFIANDVRRNLDCWRNKLRVHVALHTRKVIPWETLRTWPPKILLLQAFEFYGPATKTTWNWKNCNQDKRYG